MKLAEALLERAALENELQELQNRIEMNILYQEGTEPAEDPKQLFKELTAKLDRFEYLVAQINETNAKSKISKGETLSHALAKRQRLTREIAARRRAISRVANQRFCYSASEIRTLTAIDVAKHQAKLDKLSKATRELDALIQRANWEIDLIEPS